MSTWRPSRSRTARPTPGAHCCCCRRHHYCRCCLQACLQPQACKAPVSLPAAPAALRQSRHELCCRCPAAPLPPCPPCCCQPGGAVRRPGAVDPGAPGRRADGGGRQHVAQHALTQLRALLAGADRCSVALMPRLDGCTARVPLALPCTACQLSHSMVLRPAGRYDTTQTKRSQEQHSRCTALCKQAAEVDRAQTACRGATSWPVGQDRCSKRRRGGPVPPAGTAAGRVRAEGEWRLAFVAAAHSVGDGVSVEDQAHDARRANDQTHGSERVAADAAAQGRGRRRGGVRGGASAAGQRSQRARSRFQRHGLHAGAGAGAASIQQPGRGLTCGGGQRPGARSGHPPCGRPAGRGRRRQSGRLWRG